MLERFKPINLNDLANVYKVNGYWPGVHITWQASPNNDFIITSGDRDVLSEKRRYRTGGLIGQDSPFSCIFREGFSPVENSKCISAQSVGVLAAIRPELAFQRWVVRIPDEWKDDIRGMQQFLEQVVQGAQAQGQVVMMGTSFPERNLTDEQRQGGNAPAYFGQTALTNAQDVYVCCFGEPEDKYHWRFTPPDRAIDITLEEKRRSRRLYFRHGLINELHKLEALILSYAPPEYGLPQFLENSFVLRASAPVWAKGLPASAIKIEGKMHTVYGRRIDTAPMKDFFVLEFDDLDLGPRFRAASLKLGLDYLNLNVLLTARPQAAMDLALGDAKSLTLSVIYNQDGVFLLEKSTGGDFRLLPLELFCQPALVTILRTVIDRLVFDHSSAELLKRFMEVQGILFNRQDLQFIGWVKSDNPRKIDLMKVFEAA